MPAASTNDHDWGKNIPSTLRHSPLYRHLHVCIEQDPEIASLRGLIAPHQPFHVLFFTVINYLLLREQEEGREHPFAAFHAYLTPMPLPVEEAYPAFRDFVLLHGEELRQLLPHARLQTNEVARCANLLPAFEMVFERGGRKPLALVEIGASAGFNLYWDRYDYTYHKTNCTIPVHVTGNVPSPVQIACTLQGELIPPLPASLPEVASRIGIDLTPRHCQNANDVRWLRACIWPEERWRYDLLDAVLAVAQQDPPPVLAGDACDVLPGVLADLQARASHETLCLYHSYALQQGPAAVRERVFDLLAAHSQTRDVYRISLEWNQPRGWLTPRLELFTYQGGKQTQEEWLAGCDVHGSPMQWLV